MKCWYGTRKNKYGNWWRILKKIRSNKYDTVINVQRFAATGLLTGFSGAKEKIGFDKNPFSWLFTRKIKHIISEGDKTLHEIERNNELIKDITGAIVAKPRLYPTTDDERSVEPFVKPPFLTISPASVWFTKQYPKDKWVELINHIAPGIYHLPAGRAR